LNFGRLGIAGLTRNSAPLLEGTDEALLKKCAVGEEAAIVELARRYQRPIFAYLSRAMGSVEDAEDGTIEVFVRAWRAAPKFEFRAKVGTWLYKIAMNVARDASDRRRTRPQQAPFEEVTCRGKTSPSAEAEALCSVSRDERMAAVKKALKELPEGDRQI